MQEIQKDIRGKFLVITLIPVTKSGLIKMRITNIPQMTLGTLLSEHKSELTSLKQLGHGILLVCQLDNIQNRVLFVKNLVAVHVMV